MTFQVVDYEGPDGRLWKRAIPEGLPLSEAAVGVPIGPPPLDDLGLPDDIHVRLHNQLFMRGIFVERDARKHIDEVRAALMAALNVDAHRILGIYQGQGADNGTTQSPEGQSVARVPNRRPRRTPAHA